MRSCNTCKHQKNSPQNSPCIECFRVIDGNITAFCWEPDEKTDEITGEDANVIRQTIKDSGERRVFETGAVRDITEDKGRCDLLPLDVVNELLATGIMQRLDDFQQTGWYGYLLCALFQFAQIRFGETETMLLDVSKHFANGAKKYAENNWRKGIPLKSYIDSAVRHYLKFMRGDEDEPHDLAFCWNLLCAVWTCRHKPELNEYAKTEENEND